MRESEIISAVSKTVMLKRLILNGSAFVALGMILATVIYQYSESVSPIHPIAKERSNFFPKKQQQIEAVTVGSSHSRAIDFETLGMNGFHLWNPGGDMLEASYTVSAFIDEIPKLKYIFMTLDFGFWGADNAMNDDRRLSRYFVYSQSALYYSMPEWIDGDWKNYINSFVAPLARADRWKGVFIKETTKKIIKSDGQVRIPDRIWIPKEEGSRRYGYKARKHISRVVASLEKRPELKNKIISTMSEMIRMAKSRGLTVVLYTPPFSTEYLDVYRTKQNDLTVETRALGEYFHSELGVTYLDFSSYTPISTNSDLFDNSDHLNLEGAKHFSELLKNTLN